MQNNESTIKVLVAWRLPVLEYFIFQPLFFPEPSERKVTRTSWVPVSILAGSLVPQNGPYSLEPAAIFRSETKQTSF